jgi:hypothetical protein
MRRAQAPGLALAGRPEPVRADAIREGVTESSRFRHIRPDPPQGFSSLARVGCPQPEKIHGASEQGVHDPLGPTRGELHVQDRVDEGGAIARLRYGWLACPSLSVETRFGEFTREWQKSCHSSSASWRRSSSWPTSGEACRASMVRALRSELPRVSPDTPVLEDGVVAGPATRGRAAHAALGGIEQADLPTAPRWATTSARVRSRSSSATVHPRFGQRRTNLTDNPRCNRALRPGGRRTVPS